MDVEEEGCLVQAEAVPRLHPGVVPFLSSLRHRGTLSLLVSREAASCPSGDMVALLGLHGPRFRETSAGGLGWALVFPEDRMLRSLPQLTVTRAPGWTESAPAMETGALIRSWTFSWLGCLPGHHAHQLPALCLDHLLNVTCRDPPLPPLASLRLCPSA